MENRRYKILIDTNFFFIPFYENFDSIEELTKKLESMDISIDGLYTLRKNIWEVENKLNTAKSNKWRNIYKLVLDYINSKNVVVLDSPINEKTDRLLVNTVLSSKDKWIIATQDRNLQIVLKRLKIPYAYYSKKNIHVRLF